MSTPTPLDTGTVGHLDLNLERGTRDAATVVDAATRAAGPQPLDPSHRLHTVVSPDGTIVVIDSEYYLDSYRDRPRRKTGTFAVHDADSFINYMGKHADTEAEVWADVDQVRVVAVINAHQSSDDAGHSDHRLIYQVKYTDAWQAWTANDGKLLDQATFAEFIEDHVREITEPDGADMLELAQSFRATTALSFESSQLLSTGQRQFEYREETSAQAGKSGQLSIPKELHLALEPFEGSDVIFPVVARFRYRLTGGKLTLGYHLENPKDIVRAAFGEVTTQIGQAIEAPIFKGVTAG